MEVEFVKTQQFIVVGELELHQLHVRGHKPSSIFHYHNAALSLVMPAYSAASGKHCLN